MKLKGKITVDGIELGEIDKLEIEFSDSALDEHLVSLGLSKEDFPLEFKREYHGTISLAVHEPTPEDFITRLSYLVDKYNALYDDEKRRLELIKQIKDCAIEIYNITHGALSVSLNIGYSFITYSMTKKAGRT